MDKNPRKKPSNIGIQSGPRTHAQDQVTTPSSRSPAKIRANAMQHKPITGDTDTFVLVIMRTLWLVRTSRKLFNAHKTSRRFHTRDMARHPIPRLGKPPLIHVRVTSLRCPTSSPTCGSTARVALCPANRNTSHTRGSSPCHRRMGCRVAGRIARASHTSDTHSSRAIQVEHTMPEYV